MAGVAKYNAAENVLEVLRDGEPSQHRIPCKSINPNVDVVHDVKIDGDDIWVIIGLVGDTNPRRKLLYRFSSLGLVASMHY